MLTQPEVPRHVSSHVDCVSCAVLLTAKASAPPLVARPAAVESAESRRLRAEGNFLGAGAGAADIPRGASASAPLGSCAVDAPTFTNPTLTGRYVFSWTLRHTWPLRCASACLGASLPRRCQCRSLVWVGPVSGTACVLEPHAVGRCKAAYLFPHVLCKCSTSRAAPFKLCWSGIGCGHGFARHTHLWGAY